MRILEIVSGDKINGAIKHCYELTMRLRQRGHDVHVACLGNSWLSDRLEENGVPTILTRLKRSYNELQRIARYAREHGIQLMHTHKSKAHFFGVLMRWHAKIPVVATAHNRLMQLHWMFNDQVVAVSRATRDFQVRKNFVRKNRIHTVHNFVDVSEPEPVSPETRNDFLSEQKISAAANIVTFVGTIDTRKGLIYLVEALPEILRQHPETVVLVVGQTMERDYKANACRRARQLGVSRHLRFLGRRNDVPAILGMSDLFVLPSREESFPLTILEAMTNRLPVVATDVGGVKECVVDGETGFVVPARQPPLLAESLNRLLADPELRIQFGEAGRKSVEANFSPASQLAKIESVFEHAVDVYRPPLLSAPRQKVA